MRCPHAYDDGAYVVGSLSTEERREFVNHLPGCPECRSSVRALSGLPGLLASIDTDETGVLGGAPLEPPPPTLWPRLLSVVQRDRVRKRRRGRLLAVAACLLVLVGTAAPVAVYAPFSPVRQTGGTEQTDLPMLAMTPVSAGTSVSAEIGILDKAWGTKVALHCSYPDSRYGGEQAYKLVAIAKSGASEQIGSWSVGPGREVSADAATRFHQDELVALEIRRADDQPVLRRRI